MRAIILQKQILCNMENPFITLDQRLSHIEQILLNMQQNFHHVKEAVNSNPTVSEFMDTTEVAELARVELTTIYSYNSRGSIPIYSSETPLIYKREEILEWLANNKKLTPKLQKQMEERKLMKK